jgi:hypothetical protein
VLEQENKQITVAVNRNLFSSLIQSFLLSPEKFVNLEFVISAELEFSVSNASMRRELFSLHLPNPDRVTADYAVLAGLSRGLSGGDILNVCVNAIYAGSMDDDPERWAVTQEMMEREIAKAKKAKAEHSGDKGKNRRMIGFQPS